MAVGRGCGDKGCSCGQTDKRSRVGWFDDGACSLVFDQRVGGAQDCSCGMVDVSRYIVVGGGVCGFEVGGESEWLVVGIVEGWMTRREVE